MKARTLLFQLNDDAITRAIQDLELKTSGELRVLVSTRPVQDPLQSARQAFARLGMHRTSRRNAVLVFLAPESQKFALIYDQGYQGRTTPEFWQSLATRLHQGFQAGAYTDALVQVIAQVAAHMAALFPRLPGDANELPDTPVHE